MLLLSPQDSNGVIGLLDALETTDVPTQVPLTETVVKVASGSNGSCDHHILFVLPMSGSKKAYNIFIVIF